MDTKWKSKKDKILYWIRNYRKETFAILTGICGIYFLFEILNSSRYYSTSREIWSLGFVANLLLGIGIFLASQSLLNRIYKNWLPNEQGFYTSWKQHWVRQQLILICIVGFGLVLALFHFSNIINYRYSSYYSNYASGYMGLFTCATFFIVCECSLIFFMHKRLNQLMAQMTQINQHNLEKSIELEKKSIAASLKSEKLKIDLITNVSHDLKTPLTSIVGYLALLKKESLPESAMDYVQVLSRMTEKLKEMIDSLFSLAKTSSGNIELNPEPLLLNRLVEQILADMEDPIRDSELEFIVNLTDQNTELVTDSSYLYRICQNLIENALKYSAKDTRVFLQTFFKQRDGQKQLCFCVTNTAGYLMNFEKEQIVERFARGDVSRTSEGNGLGLAIVSTYTSALEGEFEVKTDCDQFKALLSFPQKSEFRRLKNNENEK